MEHTMRKIIALAAVLSAVAFAGTAANAAGAGKFCLNGPGSQSQCSYQTMASCEKAKKGTQTCAANSAATTGAGSSGSMGSPTGPAGGNSMQK